MDDVQDRWLDTQKDHTRHGQMDSMGNRQMMMGKSDGEISTKIEGME